MKQLLLLTAIAVYLADAVFPSRALAWLLAVLSMLIIGSVFRSVGRYVQVLGGFFLLIGAALLFMHRAEWTSYVLGFGKMMNILTLFALIPLIAVPIELGDYAVRVREMLRRFVHNPGILYAMTSFLAYGLSVFMNLATLPMVHYMIRPSMEAYPIQHKERFISRAITHGYSMPILWTPVAPIVGIIIDMTGAGWGSMLSITVPFSLLGLALDMCIGIWNAHRRPRPERTVTAEEQAATGKAGLHPIHVVAAIAALNGVILVLDHFVHVGFLLLVSFIALPFGWGWSLLIGKGAAYLERSREMLPAHVLKMKDQFYIFLCAGFLISAIEATDAGAVMNEGLLYIKDLAGAHLFVLLIPFIPLILAFVGLHPAVALAITAGSMKPAMLGISVDTAAVAMLIGAAASFLMGPYNATAGVMSNLVQQSPYRISRWNIPFTTLFLICGMVLLSIMSGMD